LRYPRPKIIGRGPVASLPGNPDYSEKHAENGIRSLFSITVYKQWIFEKTEEQRGERNKSLSAGISAKCYYFRTRQRA
jgi:hypothetical protein